MKVPKQLKGSIAFRKMSPEKFLGACNKVIEGLDHNDKFPTPPVTIAALKTEVANLVSKVANAADGSKQAIKERDKQAAVVMAMMVQLVHYVEMASGNEPATFVSSGFGLKATAHASPAQLDQPRVIRIEQGNTGQFLVSVSAVKRALTYGIQYGVLSGGNVASWTKVTISSTRPPTAIDGLTPGAVYAFQVCAFGPLGHTDWSDSVTRMCI